MSNSSSFLTQEGKTILRTFNQRDPYISDDSVSYQDTSYIMTDHNSYKQFSNPYPAKILKTKILELKRNHPKPKTPAPRPRSGKNQRCNTESSKTVKKTKKSLSRKTSFRSVHSFASSKTNNYSTKCRIYSKNNESQGKIFDVTKVPNWKIELSKFIRTAAKHKILCPQFFEEVGKIGGLKLMNNYRNI